MLIGELDATMRHVGDFRRGYDADFAAGPAAGRQKNQADRVVDGLLCRYAEVACGYSREKR